MINFKALKREIEANVKNAPIVVIDGGIRGRQNAAKLFDMSPETEWEFFFEGDFIPEYTEEKYELKAGYEEKLAEIRVIKPKSVFIITEELSFWQQTKIRHELDGITVEMGSVQKSKEAPIVVIDSGVGGLSMAKDLVIQKPTENVVFFADTEFLPYGEKEPKILARRAAKIITYIKKMEPKAVIIGCNTLDAVAGDKIESQLGSIPVIRVINTVAKKAINISSTKQIALLATQNTIDSHRYIYEIVGYHPETHLYGVECPGLAKAIEERDNIKAVFKENTEPLNDIKFDTIILGCTHYSNIKPIVKKAFPEAQIVDSGEEVINNFIGILETKLDYNKAAKGSFNVISTNKNKLFDQNLELFLKSIDYKAIEEKIK